MAKGPAMSPDFKSRVVPPIESRGPHPEIEEAQMPTMNHITEQSPRRIPADVQALFGEPPILLNEDAELYNNMMGKFCDVLKPNDVFEWWWAKELTDDTWELRRLRRLKALFVENWRNQWHANIELRASAFVKEDEPWEGVPIPDSETDSAKLIFNNLDSYKKMDALIGAAEQRRGRTLREVARYRKQVALQLRQTSDGLIDEPENRFSEAA